jgi:hypothetical protein
MRSQLSEEKLSKLSPALGILAERIGTGTVPEQQIVKEILRNIHVEAEEWAVEELVLWSRILQRARAAVNDGAKAAIAKELQSRGIQEYPAILAVEAAIPPPLTADPRSVNFGSLKPGDGAHATLEVRGQLLRATVRNSRLKVSLVDRGSGNSLVKVQLLGGSAGESLQDYVLLEGEQEEIKIPVKAEWEKEPPMLQQCPYCRKKSLFWNYRDRRFECLNLECKVEGPSLDGLVKPRDRHGSQ